MTKIKNTVLVTAEMELHMPEVPSTSELGKHESGLHKLLKDIKGRYFSNVSTDKSYTSSHHTSTLLKIVSMPWLQEQLGPLSASHNF